MKLNKKHLLRLIIALALNSLTVLALSQDTITFRDGRVQLAKVLEIGPGGVQFKRTDSPGGPLYVEPCSAILQIAYAGGLKEKFDPPGLSSLRETPYYAYGTQQPAISRSGGKYFYGNGLIGETDLQTKMLELNDPQIKDHVQQARLYRGLQNIGFLALPLMITAIYTMDQGSYLPDFDHIQPAQQLLITGAAACVAGSVYFKIGRSRHNAAAVRIYNEHY